MSGLLDSIWPRNCEVCGRPADRPGRHVCAACLMRIPFVPTDGLCRVCGRAAEGHAGEYLCEDCSGPHRPFFDRAVSAVRFEDKARQMMLDYKFNGHLWLKDDFTDWLEAAARAQFDLASVDVILPMPLTGLHHFIRGYNQSGYLAAALARRLDRRCREDVLARTGRPRRQSELDEEARRENVKGTFVVRKGEFVQGRTVLVIDDVMTTGSTLSECARVLKLAGASRVWCLTLARSIRS